MPLKSNKQNKIWYSVSFGASAQFQPASLKYLGMSNGINVFFLPQEQEA